MLANQTSQYLRQPRKSEIGTNNNPRHVFVHHRQYPYITRHTVTKLHLPLQRLEHKVQRTITMSPIKLWYCTFYLSTELSGMASRLPLKNYGDLNGTNYLKWGWMPSLWQNIFKYKRRARTWLRWTSIRHQMLTARLKVLRNTSNCLSFVTLVQNNIVWTHNCWMTNIKNNLLASRSHGTCKEPERLVYLRKQIKYTQNDQPPPIKLPYLLHTFKRKCVQ